MKKIKFATHLTSLILSGEKTVTWRLFDDKDLQAGDELIFVNRDSGEEFSKARITNMREKRLEDINDEDYEAGHERYNSQEEMYETFRGYYGDKVGPDTVVKIIKFELMK